MQTDPQDASAPSRVAAGSDDATSPESKPSEQLRRDFFRYGGTAAAGVLLGGNLEQPRHPADWPETNPSFTPTNPEETPPHPAHAHKDKPLTPPARGLLGLLLARNGCPRARSRRHSARRTTCSIHKARASSALPKTRKG